MTTQRSWSNRPTARIASKAVALLGVLGAKYATCQPDELDCARAISDASDGVAVLVCKQEYVRTHDPATGAKLANVLRRTGNLLEASALASTLVATSAQSDALQVLGKIAISQRRTDDGRRLLETARERHIAEQRHREVAVDDQALAGIFRSQKNYAEALRRLHDGILEARQAEDRVIEGYCHVSAGLVLSEVGYFSGAEEELGMAQGLLVRDRDLADLAIERGTLALRNGLGSRRLFHAEAAAAQFERAIEHASAAALTRVERKAELNLVYALAERGKLDEAARHLEAARRLDVDDTDRDERALLGARIAYRRGELVQATSINTQTYGRLTDEDDQLRVCVMQADIGLKTGVLDDAITWATRGVEVAEAMRAHAALELRPWALAVRRQPHELLFVALARAHRFEDAVLAFDRWQGRTLLDQLARGRDEPLSDLRTVAQHTEGLAGLVQTLTDAPIMKPTDRGPLLAGLAAVDLVAVLVAHDELWRITARHGQIDVVRIGELEALRPAIDRFRSEPTRAELGEALGQALLGGEAFRDTGETLHVLLDGEIAGVPVPALRARGKLLIAMRPIVHAARLSEVGCVPPAPRPRGAVVLADAKGDLPVARREAQELAAELHVSAAVGAAATHDALFAAGREDLLHVALHTTVGMRGGELSLYDGQVSALEIAGRRAGPALVVLSTCASAAARDAEPETSLAAAFLTSGSPQVIATLRKVSDAGAAEIARAFYRDHGAADPARTLARIQTRLATTHNVDWPHFLLYGRDVCRKETP